MSGAIFLPSRIHDDDEAGVITGTDLYYPGIPMSLDEPWQEEWRFHLHEEEGDKTRGYLQFGGRLNLKEHFLPRAKIVCQEHNLSLVRVEGFQASVNLGDDQYTVSALVTLTRNPSNEGT